MRLAAGCEPGRCGIECPIVRTAARGEVPERLNGLVSKTSEPSGSVGSNPTLSVGIADNVGPRTAVYIPTYATLQGWDSNTPRAKRGPWVRRRRRREANPTLSAGILDSGSFVHVGRFTSLRDTPRGGIRTHPERSEARGFDARVFAWRTLRTARAGPAGVTGSREFESSGRFAALISRRLASCP